MRYFTIYVTQGGYLKVVSKRDEKRAFNWFAKLVEPNPRYEPPIWALLLSIRPTPGDPFEARLHKVFGDIP